MKSAFPATAEYAAGTEKAGQAANTADTTDSAADVITDASIAGSPQEPGDVFDYLRQAAPDSFLRDWRAVRLLGTGSCGSVYEIEKIAGEAESASRSALKIIALKQGGEEQLVNEVRAMKVLADQPGAVHIYDCTEIRLRLPYFRYDSVFLLIRMELLEPLPSGRMNEREAIRLGTELCGLLEYCHTREPKLIHCDIKPQNIFAAPGGYKLGDFDQVRLLEKTLSSTGGRGTLAYMAPEMYRGGYGEACDIYSLGVTLYSLMAADERAVSEKQMLRRMNGGRLPWLPTVSRRMNRVLRKACAFSPKKRYASAAQFGEALRKCLHARLRELAALLLCAAIIAAAALFVPRFVFPHPSVPAVFGAASTVSSASGTIAAVVDSSAAAAEDLPIERCTIDVTFHAAVVYDPQRLSVLDCYIWYTAPGEDIPSEYHGTKKLPDDLVSGRKELEWSVTLKDVLPGGRFDFSVTVPVDGSDREAALASYIDSYRLDSRDHYEINPFKEDEEQYNLGYHPLIIDIDVH